MNRNGRVEQIAQQTYKPGGQPLVRRASITEEPQTHISAKKRVSVPAVVPEEEEVYDDPPLTRLPSSARRYNYPPNTRQQRIVIRQQPLPPPVQRQSWHPLFYLGLALLFVVVGLTLAPSISTLWQHFNDSRVYGYPRTYQVWQDVGHGGVSHFIALNNKGVIEVVELPSDPATEQPHLYVVATMTGTDADVIAVTITFLDAKGNGKPDMEVWYNGSVITLYNTGTSFTTKHP